MAEQLGYAILEVGGIQQFILGTGKLKEMIGGSELVDALSKKLLEEACKQGGWTLIDAKEAKRPQGREILSVQRNAGAMHLVFPSLEEAKGFTAGYQAQIAERYPGVPLFGATVPFEWTAEAYKEARSSAASLIDQKRASRPVCQGMPMMPFCRHSRLDGLPAVAKDKEQNEYFSLPSQTRRGKGLLDDSRERLRKLAEGILPGEVKLTWCDDLNELAGGEKARVALIHIDGNDLGNMFREYLVSEKYQKQTLEERIANMGQLSELVEEANERAFKEGLRVVLRRECKDHRQSPLVLGGDDVTAIVRADLSLAFINAYVREFERFSKEKGTRISVGIGMTVTPTGYPFTRAFALAEDLLKSAKKKTDGMNREKRPSSLDWLIINNDVEPSLEAIRRHIATAGDGSLLTAKPLVLGEGDLPLFVVDGWKTLTMLPRSAMRGVLNKCRLGVKYAREDFEQQLAKLRRGLGSAKMTEALFLELFPENYFITENGKAFTRVADYLELETLLPSMDEAVLDELFGSRNVQ